MHIMIEKEYDNIEVQVIYMSLETISAKEVDKYIGQYNVKIVDIRCYNDYKKGHIKNAINIPYEEFEQINIPFKFDDEIILYCERGNLSLILGRDLSKAGYHVKSIYGGIYAYRGMLIKE